MRLDPEQCEWKHLQQLADFGGARVLEVGCGDGRIAARYAGASALAIGVDVGREALAGAPLLAAQASARSLPFGRRRFDIALFGWSL